MKYLSSFLSVPIMIGVYSGTCTAQESPPTGPIITASSGSGAYPFGTEEVALGIQTQNPSECRLSGSSGHPFGALYLNFATDAGLAHSYTLSTYDPGDFTYYAVCRDLETQTEGPEEVIFNITITSDADPTDTTLAPQITYLSGNGPHTYGTPSVTITLETDTDANCRFSYSEGYPYGALYENFESLDNRIHTFVVDTYDSTDQTFFARCESIANGVANEEDFPLPVTFLDEGETGNNNAPVISVVSETEFENSLSSIDLQISTDIESACRLSLSGPYDYDVLYTDLLTTDGLTHSYTLDTYGGGDKSVHISCISIETQTISETPYTVNITMPEGTGDTGNTGSDEEVLSINTEYETPFVDNNLPVAISENANDYIVNNAGIAFRLSKKSLNLIAEKNGRQLVKSLGSTVRMNGTRLSVSAPEEHSKGDNWIEFRGWYNEENNLWYVARYRFWPNQPFVHLSFSLTDRHDNHPTEAHWDALWSQREIQDFRVFVNTPDRHETKTVVQENAFSGGDYSLDSRIIEKSADGETHWRQVADADGDVQLIHWAENSGKTFLRINPNQAGIYNLTLRQKPLSSPYPAANSVTVVVKHANGQKRIIVDQGESENILGQFTLDAKSYIRILAKSAEDSDRIVFGSLELSDQNGEVETISAHRVKDNVIDSNGVGLVVKDFWKQFPILARANGKQIFVSAIRKPVALPGGAGLTLDLGLNFDADTTPSSELVERMNAAPEPDFPDWWHDIDGVVTSHPAYNELMALTPGIINTNDETSGNYGWQNWGDYQIGNSYFTDGEPTENWGALQYDLGHGLLMSWMQTGDAYLWNRAKASIRSSMDIQIAKFEPYLQKRSGAGLRKGECTINFHWCQENIPDFNYHTRSLLLYSHLTGEQWPKNIARMLIDNSAYFAHTRREWMIETGSRPLAWSLRNLVYGHKVFADGTYYNESEEYGYEIMPRGTAYADLLNTLVHDLVANIEASGHLPGDQPVWQAQILEGMIMAYDSGVLDETLQERTFSAISDSLAYFDNNNIRAQSGSGFEMVYDSDTVEWTDAATYGWFWVNNYAWAGVNIDRKYAEKSGELIDWLSELYLTDYHSTRAWSGVMGFPSYAVSLED